MIDQPSRFDTSSRSATHNFDDARRRFEPEDSVGGFRGWCNDHLPGGEKSLWVVVALIVLVAFVWWLLPGRTTSGMGRGMGGPQPVGVAISARGSIDVTINGLGTVTPLATVTVRPQVSGQINRINFREGQMVKAGDPVAEIDPRSFQAALEQAQGQLARDQAQLDNARIELKRQRALMAAKATSQQNLDNQIATVGQYEGAVKSDQANVDAATINLGYTKVIAPVAGRAGIRQVDVGNFVSAGQSGGIVVVTQLQPISVLFTVPEDNIRAILTRINTGERLKVEAYDRQWNLIATGRLSAMDSQVDDTTGTVKMRAMFDNEDGLLFPNQFVNVKLLVDTQRNQVVIPVAAVQRGSQGNYVFVVKSDKTVAMRAVTLGQQQGDKVAVTAGVSPGETVVTDGADRLRDGGEVTIPGGQKVVDVKAPAGAAAGPGGAMSDAERAARRAKMMAACGADIKKFCGDVQGREMFMCLRENRDNVSDVCRAEMKNMRRGGGGGFGGPRGGPPGGGPPPG